MLAAVRSWMRPEAAATTTGLSINKWLPPELILHILSYVDAQTLVFSCRLVCLQWRGTVEDTQLWRLLLARSGVQLPKLPRTAPHWPVYYWIAQKAPFNRNLIWNACGADGLDGWTILQDGGHQWKVEDPPSGADAVPEEVGETMCFATSYGPCVMEQTVNLWREGLVPFLLDSLQPVIAVSEFNAARFDCGCVYNMGAQLLDYRGRVIKEIGVDSRTEQWLGKEWKKEERKFEDYGKGVKAIRFVHGGQDTQFWAGHYGSKMTGASVVVLPPQ